MPKISIIIPTLNEEKCIRDVVRSVHRALDGNSHEIIVVDDGSVDGTLATLLSIQKEIKSLRVIRREGARDLSHSVCDGIRLACGQHLIVMDGDGQHAPEATVTLAQELAKTPLVIASRYAGISALNIPWYRRGISRVGRWIFSIGITKLVSDPLSGFFGMHRDVFDRVAPHLRIRGFKILLEILRAYGDGPLKEIPFAFRPRQGGKSKLSLRILLLAFSQFIKNVFPFRVERTTP